MEVMRMMLNAPRLNIIGASFGTRITALYQERFPTVSGRIILDAPLPPHAKIDTMMRETAAAQQHSFNLMLNACAAGPLLLRTRPDGAFLSYHYGCLYKYCVTLHDNSEIRKLGCVSEWRAVLQWAFQRTAGL